MGNQISKYPNIKKTDARMDDASFGFERERYGHKNAGLKIFAPVRDMVVSTFSRFEMGEFERDTARHREAKRLLTKRLGVITPKRDAVLVLTGHDVNDAHKLTGFDMSASYPLLGNLEDIWPVGETFGQMNYANYSGTYEIVPFFNEQVQCDQEFVDFDRLFSLNRGLMKYNESKAKAMECLFDSDEKWLQKFLPAVDNSIQIGLDRLL
ncbi:MAG: hypothetical protein LBG88_04025 [Christensenellaceae bacterium]|jgi:hypothetical protein|nr:hypothetical protein [Christensenellaceae bacterium]